MSSHRCLPDPVWRVATDVYHVFLALQIRRYEPWRSHGLPCRRTNTPRALHSTTRRCRVSPQHVSMESVTPRSLTDWCELYRVSIRGLGDETAHALWGLVSSILSILEQAGCCGVWTATPTLPSAAGARYGAVDETTTQIDSVNASAVLSQWYAEYMIEDGQLYALIEDIQSGVGMDTHDHRMGALCSSRDAYNQDTAIHTNGTTATDTSTGHCNNTNDYTSHPGNNGSIHASNTSLHSRRRASLTRRVSDWTPYVALGLHTMERCFYAGRCDLSAVILETVLQPLRRGKAVCARVLTAEVESCLADVLWLLRRHRAVVQDPRAHAEWVARANELVYEARRVLGDRFSASARSSASSVANEEAEQESLAEQLKLLCLDMLLIMSGDAVLVRTRCQAAGLSFFDYLSAVCALIDPFASLPVLHRSATEALPPWEASLSEAERWLCGAVLSVLSVRSGADVVQSMSKISTRAAQAYDWTPDNMYRSSSPLTRADTEQHHHDSRMRTDQTKTDCGDTDEDEDEAATDVLSYTLHPTDRSARRLALACMAAHVSDLCAPPIAASSSEEIELTLVRNELVTRYLALLAGEVRLWKVRAMYLAYSPLVNPVELYHTVLDAAAAAAVPASDTCMRSKPAIAAHGMAGSAAGSTTNHPLATGCASATTGGGVCLDGEEDYRRLGAFMRRLWHPQSAHQRSLRQALEERLPGSAAVQQWLEAMRYFYGRAHEAVHRCLVTRCFHRGDAGYALWLAMESGVGEDVLHEAVRSRLRAPTALSDVCLRQIGDAVGNGFVSMERSGAVRMAQGWVVCVCLARYDRTRVRWTWLRGDGIDSCEEAAAAGAASLRAQAAAPWLRVGVCSLWDSKRAAEDETSAAAAAAAPPCAHPAVETWCEALQAGTECLQSTEALFHALCAAGVTLHPVCVMQLVEDAVDVMFAIRRLLTLLQRQSVCARDGWEVAVGENGAGRGTTPCNGAASVVAGEHAMSSAVQLLMPMLPLLQLELLYSHIACSPQESGNLKQRMHSAQTRLALLTDDHVNIGDV